jgi:hypothetical protein
MIVDEPITDPRMFMDSLSVTGLVPLTRIVSSVCCVESDEEWVPPNSQVSHHSLDSSSIQAVFILYSS